MSTIHSQFGIDKNFEQQQQQKNSLKEQNKKNWNTAVKVKEKWNKKKNGNQ